MISGERTYPNTKSFFYWQHLSAYNYLIKYINNKTILEVGCGSGYGTKFIAKYAKNIDAIDIDKSAIKFAKNNFPSENIKYTVTSIDNISDYKKYDIIFSFQVIEHVNNVPDFLKVISRLLKPKGKFILSTPNSLTQNYNQNPYHIKEYSPTELKNFLKEYFLKVELIGLAGNNKVIQYEQLRRKQIETLFKLDLFNLRKRMPLFLRQILFDFASNLRRQISVISNKQNENFNINDFNIVSQLDKPKNYILDIIAVCSI